MRAPAAARSSRPRLWDGDTFEHKGYTFRVRFARDEFMGAPWDEHDGHGPVSDWRPGYTKRPGERVLHRDREAYRFYDFAEAVKIARRDQWGSEGDEGLAPGAKAARAAERDFEYLRSWCRDDWQWVSIDVEYVDPVGGVVERESLGGVESSDEAYLTDCAYELADAIVGRLEVDEPDVVPSEN